MTTNNMRLSPKGLAEIAGSEGVIPMPYLDSVGVWTFGIGHTNPAGAPNPIHMVKGKNYGVDKCIGLFIKDMVRYEDGVNRAVKVPLEQHEFDALVSFHYNTGGIHRARLTKLLNMGAPRKQVAEAFMGWLRPIEIKGRRAGERDLFYTGTYKHKGMATYQLANKRGKKLKKGRKSINIARLITEYQARESGKDSLEKIQEDIEFNNAVKEIVEPKVLKDDVKGNLLLKIFNFFKK